MSLTKYLPVFSLLILLASPAIAQTNTAVNSDPEIKSERGMYSKVYLKDNGDHQAVFSNTPVHYKKNGAWEDINTTLTSTNNGYQNESNAIQSYFPNTIDSSTKIKLIVNGTDEIFFHSEKKLVWMIDQTNATLTALHSNNSTATITDNTITYPNIYAGISDEFAVLNGKIKNNVVLSAPPTLLNNVSSGYFGFLETVELPNGWKITTSDNTLASSTSSPLQIVDANGKPILTIPAPVFFDHNGLESDGANSVEGKYLVIQENGFWTITTLVPVAWLKDANTNYPVTIDPTVIIAGTTGGWQSPNNWVDNPSFVFIGVCCGNLTHRAWIKFNISTIPAGSCITNVELQVNVITVAANSPELVWIDDVTGAFGPYGGIIPAAYTDFGTGPYTSFTINGTGVYGYYTLGVSANTLLQTQLPGGWFQTAFMFNNEPSTVYKIIDATTSNLRVTYSATPCPLPVTLLSFDATCDNGKVNLKWSTASQTNNDHFSVERTTDGINYTDVGTIPGAGNSSQILRYSFVDAESSEGTEYYRLKQTDFNGQFEYSNLIAVTCDDAKEFTISPNPNSGTFTIEGAQQNSDVIISDVLGRIVLQTKVVGEKTEIDLSKELNGIYFVQVISGDGIVEKKVVVNR